MKIVADLHTHTLVSQHAYSTIDELCTSAREKGLCALAVTDHGPGMPDGAIGHHFFCMAGLPERVNGVLLYKGIEANMTGFDGTLDVEDGLLNVWIL